MGTLLGEIGYLNRHASGDDVSVTMIGITNNVGYGDNDKSSVYLGAGVDINIGGAGKLELRGKAFTGSEMTGYQGSATMKLLF